MPKGKKKGKYEHRRTEQEYSSEEDAGIDMTIDNCSEISGQSDLRSIQDEAENELQEKFEDKVIELIDGLSARSNAARASALVSLRNALQRRPLCDLLCNHRVTLSDHVTKILRRGKDGERKAAAALVPLLSLQIGEEGAEEFVKELRPALTATVVDKSASLETRVEGCASLSVICYLLEEDLGEVVEVMRVFEAIFSGSYLKGDGSVKVSGSVVEEGSLHSAAVDGWALLLSLLPPRSAHAAAPARLAELLHAHSLEVRMAAGNALAIFHECISEVDELVESYESSVAALLPTLEQLARDSHKYRAKRDRKLQRATFRDVLKYFEDSEPPEATSVRCGAEQVAVETWGARALYAALADRLGAGLQALCPACEPLRRALALPPAPPPRAKGSRLQRHLQNNAASKARTQARNKNRDKRSAALAL